MFAAELAEDHPPKKKGKGKKKKKKRRQPLALWTNPQNPDGIYEDPVEPSG